VRAVVLEQTADSGKPKQKKVGHAQLRVGLEHYGSPSANGTILLIAIFFLQYVLAYVWLMQ